MTAKTGEREAWLEAQTSKQLLKTVLSRQLIDVSRCFKFPSYGSQLTKRHPREATRQRRFMRCIRNSYTLSCVTEFKQHGCPFRPAWCTEQWDINGGKSGLSSSVSSASGWNLKTFTVGDEMLKLMIGGVRESGSNCYQEEMEVYSDGIPVAAVTAVTFTIRLMWLSTGVTRQINEMASLHNVRMMDDAPGS